MTSGTTESPAEGLRHAIVVAHGAVIDGRLDNLAFKHKQLYALFEGLQQHSLTLPLGERAPLLLLELEYTLRSISQALDGLPYDLKRHFESEQKLQDIGFAGSRRTALGVVVIVVDDRALISSWAVPLAQAIIDGNATIILTPSSMSLPKIPGLDHEAHHTGWYTEGVVDQLLEAARGNVAVVGGSSNLPSTYTINNSPGLRVELRPTPDGLIPLIIDQSILSRRPLSPAEEASGCIPASMSRVACQIASALRGEGSAGQGVPKYLLVHENVVEPLVRALALVNPHLDTQVRELALERSKARSFVRSQTGGSLSFMPIFSVRSIDMAIDFLLNDAPKPPVAYVFASPRFASYAYNSLKSVPTSHLNRLPTDALILGAYADRRLFSFSSEARATYVPRPKGDHVELKSSIERTQNLKARKLKQPLGHRIDFFGGSFMFAGGLTASAILAGTGYGIFKAAKWIWIWSRTS